MQPDNKVKIFFDTETTGNDKLTDRVVEFGFLVSQGDKILESYQQYVNPEKPSSYEAYKIHNISDEFLKDKPKFKEIYPKIIDVLVKYDPYSLTMHNSDFDAIMLSQEFQRLYDNDGIHIMDYMKKQYPDFILEKHRTYHYDKETDSYYYTGKKVSELKKSEYTLSLMDIIPIEDTMLVAANIFDGKLSLNELAKNLNVDATARADIHGALVDADLTFRCYRKLKETYLREYDFLDMSRNLLGLNRQDFSINDDERVPESLANQLLDMNSLKAEQAQVQKKQIKL